MFSPHRAPINGLPPLPLLRAFEAAARTASFTAAARELNITQAAVSYQVRALEEHLGFTLFDRAPRGVKLTAMGVAYFAPVRKAFDDLAISTVGLFGVRSRVRIVVQAPVSLAALWLAPRLPQFSSLHPDIEVRLSSTVWDKPSPDDAVDLEIRYGDGRFPAYQAERLIHQDLMIAGSPALLSEAKGGDVFALVRNRLINIMGNESHWLSVFSALKIGDVPASPGPTVDTTIAALEMAAAGVGFVLTHPLFLAPYLRSGRLVEAAMETFPDPLGFYVVTPDRPQRVRRELHLFREWLKAEGMA
jgi:LysR family glycine cleavage system transcriptional activator